jgi:prophage regulatory protein
VNKTPAAPTALPQTGYLRLGQIVPHFFPIGKTTWWQRVKEGRYPRPVKLGPRTTAWRAEDIRALIERESAAATQ